MRQDCDIRVYQVPPPTQEDLHRGREEAASVGVQGADEDEAGGDEAVVVPGGQPRRGRPQPQSSPGTVLSHAAQHHGVRGAGRVQGLRVAHL